MKPDLDYVINQASKLSPIDRRTVCVRLLESLMVRNDTTYEVYMSVFAALDQPETILVLEN